MSQQQMEALAKANRVYRDRAILKRAVSSGDTTVAAVVMSNPPEAAGMTVYKLLIAQHRWGTDRVGRFLRSVPLSESRRVGELTDRERDRLVARLNGSAPVGWEEAA
jgi:hypothetical protein